MIGLLLNFVASIGARLVPDDADEFSVDPLLRCEDT
jgi:hypothetical protein